LDREAANSSRIAVHRSSHLSRRGDTPSKYISGSLKQGIAPGIGADNIWGYTVGMTIT
jgi:hypothetical protein